MVGMNPKGEKLKSFTYDLKEAGYKIGIATNVSIDHATPATFFASTSHRENYYEIASQLAPSGFDFFAGSGFLEPTGKDKTKENICNLIRKADYALIRMPEELEQVPASQKIVMVQAETDGIECSRESLVRAIDRTGNDGWTLTDFTKIGIDLLKNSQFFFMIEGGQIDWESHDNNMPAMIQEMIDFSKAVEIALEFYEQYPEETLIIVTSDHETGGLTLNKFEWTGTDHTGEDVPIFAIGAGSELFRGKNDNTDVAKNIKRLTVRN
jgi:alkaline phosphatase